jgi:dephospho-CoA kinase
MPKLRRLKLQKRCLIWLVYLTDSLFVELNKIMSKIIVGLTGPMASGKGTVKNYIVEKYAAKDCRFSSILRDILNRVDMPICRENLQKISTSLRQIFGEDLLAKAITKDAQSLDSNIVVIDGVRRMADIGHLIKLDNFILVSVDADLKTRYERLILRKENEDDKSKTFQAFLDDHKNEAEIAIPEVMSYAKEKINNDGSLTDLYQQIDEIIKNHLK